MQNIATPLLICAAAGFVTQTALAYETVMIRNTGPANNRVNIVVLGDGYLESELPQLQADVESAFGNIADEPFYAEYADFINVKLVLTSSTSNEIGNGSPGSTLFGLYFFCQGIDRLICIGDYAQVTDVLNQDAPEWDLVAIIANSPNYGGSGGQFVTFTRDSTSTQLFIHESAHQFATLADEYPDAYPSYPLCDAECPEANVTPVASPWQNLKWNYWVNPATPLPTPDTAQYANSLGAFEGARYQATGLFRPRHTCRMRATDQTFCEVCAEAHVLETYRLVSEFDTTTPSTAQVSLASNTPVNLSVTHPQTLHNSVQYSWNVDGTGVTGTSSSLSLPAGSLSVGDHTVRVRLSDTSAFAGRDDPLLHKEQIWQIRVTAPNGTGGTAGVGGASGTGGMLHSLGGSSNAAGAGGTLVAIGGTTNAFGGNQSTVALTTAGTTQGSGGGGNTTGGSANTAGGTVPTGSSGAQVTGGTATAQGGTSSSSNGGANGVGGTSTGGATSIVGGTASSLALGGSQNSAGGSMMPTGGTPASSTSTLSGGASSTRGSVMTSGSASLGGPGNSTNPAGDRDVKASCSCAVPGQAGHPAVAALWGAIGWLLLRRRRRQEDR